MSGGDRNATSNELGTIGPQEIDDIQFRTIMRIVMRILTRDEVRRLLVHMDGTPRLMAQLMYGTGMRLMECARLRVKDLDLARNEIVVRQGKGNKDRLTMVPTSLARDLRAELNRARIRWEADVAARRPGVESPARSRANTPAPPPHLDA
jgi:integrase